MTNKKQKTIYKSFEELRSELFPELVESEKINKLKRDAKQFGSHLANKAVDKIISD